MNYKKVNISTELSEDIDRMVNKIQEVFGLKISKIQASKIIACKSKFYNINLTEKQLVEILGGRNAKSNSK